MYIICMKQSIFSDPSVAWGEIKNAAHLQSLGSSHSLHSDGREHERFTGVLWG